MFSTFSAFPCPCFCERFQFTRETYLGDCQKFKTVQRPQNRKLLYLAKVVKVSLSMTAKCKQMQMDMDTKTANKSETAHV